MVKINAVLTPQPQNKNMELTLIDNTNADTIKVIASTLSLVSADYFSKQIVITKELIVSETLQIKSEINVQKSLSQKINVSS
jgi:hypothetical protein